MSGCLSVSVGAGSPRIAVSSRIVVSLPVGTNIGTELRSRLSCNRPVVKVRWDQVEST